MQCFYAARLESGHPRGAINIDFRLTNGLVSNYEYSNGDGQILSSTNDAAYRDDVLTAQVVPHFDNHPFAHRPDFMDDID
jgi:hypothetical protein